MEDTKQAVAIVDLGGQYAHLIAVKLRASGYHAVLVDPDTPAGELARYGGVVLSGSPDRSSQEEGASDYDRRIFETHVPILGICFGHQELAKAHGGKVAHTGHEFGPATLHLTGYSPLFEGLEAEQLVWMSHGDTVTSLPEGFEELGFTVDSLGRTQHNAAIGHVGLRRYGLQFHPEVDDTPAGQEMLANFAGRICGCPATWRVSNLLEGLLAEIREQVAGRRVFLLASGGVDSTVLAWLLSRAIGPERVHLVHVDTGLMRHGESQDVVGWFQRAGVSRHVELVDASDRFLAALEGVADPEEKRRRIGEAFVAVLEEVSGRFLSKDFLLAQGTIYPDTIESGGSRKAAVIKTHHNRVAGIQRLMEAGRLIEPLRDFYKEEVRELGRLLGVPREAVERHPFPGPGLGVRVLGSEAVTGPDPELERLGRAVASEHGFGLRVLPIRSVGVKGDLRSYEHPFLLLGDYDPDAAEIAAVEVVNRVSGLNRGVLFLGETPAEELSSRPAWVDRKRLALAREADRLVEAVLRARGLWQEIWQCPVVLVPVGPGGEGELVVLRPVSSRRAMTARPYLLPEEVARELAEGLRELVGVWGVGLDVTPKPPGTIEWE